MAENIPEKKIDVDDSWKQQAQQEKEQLSGAGGDSQKKEEAKASERPGRRQLPKASFALMVEEYATQIMLSLGLIAHPATGKPRADLEVAKHYIDMLAVLEEKTKGNLSPEEQRALDSVLYEMRMRYVQVAQGR